MNLDCNLYHKRDLIFNPYQSTSKITRMLESIDDKFRENLTDDRLIIHAFLFETRRNDV